MKKEHYFTPESIQSQSGQMREELGHFRSKHDPGLIPQRSALLILDMQRYFLDETSHAFIPSGKAIIPGIARLIDTYDREALPVIFTRHINSDADAGMMSRWWHDLIRQDDPLSEIIPELDASRRVVIRKSQYDAFHHTDLEDSLRQNNVTQLVICGVMTHLCCETTARAAFVRGFEVFFTIDGTAAYNEEFHRATLLNLSHGFAVPVLIDEILTALSESNAN
ncbi:MAG: isochorismatase family protein [Chloroflexota bacterium]|nr:isochorismatase family protein [Chloroflexota bacterium]